MKRKLNPIIVAIQRSFPRGGTCWLDVDHHRSPDPALDWLIANAAGDATIREIGVLILKALLLGDREIVRIVKDALKESDHLFKRDRERVLRKKVIKCFPDMASMEGLDIVAIKREIGNVAIALTNCDSFSGTGCARP